MGAPDPSNSISAWILSVVVIALGLFLAYPQPDLNLQQDILPLARQYASSSSASSPLQGVKVVITGATNGIGLGLVKQFAAMGATVIALGRSPAKLKALQEEIQGQVKTVQVQLSDLESVQAASQEIANQFDRIDILINNAGIHYLGQSEIPAATPQGIDQSFGVNYVSHFLLTEWMVPLLRNSTHHPTVVQVSSSFHWAVDGSELVVDNKDNRPISARPGAFQGAFGPQRAYSNSKLAQILHARAFQRRYKDISIKSICPCWVGTGIAGDGFGVLLGRTAFPYDGYGIKSALLAALDTSTTTGADFFTNSPWTQLVEFFPTQFFTPWIYQSQIRDAVIFSFANLLLTLQKFTTSVEARTSSPESYNESLQEALYQWSYKTVQPYL